MIISQDNGGSFLMRWSSLRATLLACGLAITAPVVDAAEHSGGASTKIGNSRSIDLRETLEAGLRARRPEEFAFIGRVVAMVERGDLPLSLVQSTFQWARKKRPYPYVFFERGLKRRAAALGIPVK
jgi:hypothetical protein